MKYRLDYERLADALVERGLADREALRSVLEDCAAQGQLFPEILVQEGLVSDWEVARVASEVFGLPFLPVDVYPPSAAAREGLDEAYLHQFGLVPLDRFGTVLTVAMPGIVPTETLRGLDVEEDVLILPVIGTVVTNRQWLATNMAVEEEEEEPQVAALEHIEAALPGDPALEEGGDWANIFDAGEEAVQINLRQEGGEDVEL